MSILSGGIIFGSSSGNPTIVKTIADEATYSTGVSASGGATGEVTVFVAGVATEYATFTVDNDGTVTLKTFDYTAKIATTNIDGYFCIVNDSGTLKFINQLGSSAVVKYIIEK